MISYHIHQDIANHGHDELVMLPDLDQVLEQAIGQAEGVVQQALRGLAQLIRNRFTNAFVQQLTVFV